MGGRRCPREMKKRRLVSLPLIQLFLMILFEEERSKKNCLLYMGREFIMEEVKHGSKCINQTCCKSWKEFNILRGNWNVYKGFTI